MQTRNDPFEHEPQAVAERGRTSEAPGPRTHLVEPSPAEARNLNPSRQLLAVSRPGRPLAPRVRRAAEQQLGHDFSAVRIHADEEASRAAAELGARGYTLGRHIAIRREFDDQSSSTGRGLLMHELRHVVQQATFRDHQLGEAQVLGASHASEREARATTGALTPLPWPAIQCDDERSPAGSGTSLDTQDDLLEQIQRALGPAAGGAGPAARERMVTIFNALEPSSAALVYRAITGGKLPGLNRLPEATRKRLQEILAQRRAAVPVVKPGVYGRGVGQEQGDYFIVREGVTVAEVAHYLSDDPRLADKLKSLNAALGDRPLAEGTQVYFPKGLTLRPAAARERAEAIRTGSFIMPWGAWKVVHTSPRGGSFEGVRLTESEYASIRENQREQRPRPRKQAPADPDKALKEDFERAGRTPNALLTALFPTTRLYVRDQAPLIRNDLARFQYQVDMRGFDAATNLNVRAGAVAVAVNLIPLLVIEAPAAVEVAGEAGVGEATTYGLRYVYLNAPTLYADLAAYSGAVLTGASLAIHIDKVLHHGLDLSDIPGLAEDLLPFFGGLQESRDIRVATGRTPAPALPAESPASGVPPAPARISWGGRQVRNVYLALKLTADEVTPPLSDIAGPGTGRPAPARIEPLSRPAAPTAQVAIDPSVAPTPTPTVAAQTLLAPRTPSVPPAQTAPTGSTVAPPPVVSSPAVPTAVALAVTAPTALAVTAPTAPAVTAPTAPAVTASRAVTSPAPAPAQPIATTIAQRVNDFASAYPKVDISTPDALAALTELFTRSSSGTRVATPRPGEYVPILTRGAADELRAIVAYATDPNVVRLRPIPSTTQGRSPDMAVTVRQPDGSVVEFRAEVTAVTGARRGYQPVGGGSRRQAASPTDPRGDVVEATVDGLVRAVTRKVQSTATHPSQLVAPVPGLAAGGEIVIVVQYPGPNVASTVANAMSAVAAFLADKDYVTAITFDVRGGVRIRYVRAANNSYQLAP